MIGVFYTIYDGHELLEASVVSLLKQVDKIIFVWQDVSNNGNKSNTIEDVIKKIGLQYNINSYKFTPDLKQNAKVNELNKHNYALEQLKKEGCKWFIPMACDHFYNEKDFVLCKEEAKQYDVTFTKMYTYYKYTTVQITPVEEYVAPFICRLHSDTKFVKTNYEGIVTDPSTRLNTRNKTLVFHEDEIMLHHYSMVRSDIKEKILNSASYKRFGAELSEKLIKEFNEFTPETGKRILYFNNSLTKVVPDYFNLSKVMSGIRQTT